MEILLSIYTELQPILTGTAMRLLHMCIFSIRLRLFTFQYYTLTNRFQSYGHQLQTFNSIFVHVSL